MLKPEKVETINQLSTSIISTTIDSLISNTTKWGSINFELAKEDLSSIYSLCSHLLSLPVAILTEAAADKIIESLTRCGQTVTKIKDFNIESGNPTGNRDQIISEVKTHAEQLLNNTKEWVPFLAYHKGDVQKNIEELSGAVTEAKGILENASKDVASTKKTIDKIVTAAREASASAGVAVFTNDFSDQASSLNEEAKKWLIATAVLAAITLIAAIIFLFVQIDVTKSKAQIFQYLSSKIILFVVLITSTIWCGRIYKALKHQVTVNSHRANALKTFQAFVSAAADDSTRDAVLLETTNSIFSSSPSGYLDATEGTPDASKKVYEIVKTIGEVNKNTN